MHSQLLQLTLSVLLNHHLPSIFPLLFSTFLSLSTSPLGSFAFSSPVISPPPVSLFLFPFSSASAVPRGYETGWEIRCMCRCHGLSSLVEEPLMVLGIIHPARWAVFDCHTAAAAVAHACTDIHIKITAAILPTQEYLLFPLVHFDVGTAVVSHIFIKL